MTECNTSIDNANNNCISMKKRKPICDGLLRRKLRIIPHKAWCENTSVEFLDIKFTIEEI